VGLLGSEKTIDIVFPHVSSLRSSADLVLLRGVTTGGSTSISCGNAVRAENGLNEIGLDLSQEYREIEGMLNPTETPRSMWRPVTERMFDSAEDLGLCPSPTPKMVDMNKCVSCGLCELGCKTGARWSATSFFKDIEACGGRIFTESPVSRVIVKDGKAKGVEAAVRGVRRRLDADAVVLTAGGIGTAQILKASGIPSVDRLWVDVVLTLGGVLKDAHQFRENPMAWHVKQPEYILSPYPDILSHMFHKPWRGVPAGDRVGVMVKMADDQNGSVNAKGEVHKELTVDDRARLAEGIDLAECIMRSAGVKGPYVEGILNGGHLGGTVPLSKEYVQSMRPSWLPEGLWVADLSLLPKSQGLPTIMTTMALALKVSRKVE
jgi:ferredoxin